MNHYHAALVELLRAAEAGELDQRDLEAINQAADKRFDARAVTRELGDLVGLTGQPPTSGFFRALRKAMS